MRKPISLLLLIHLYFYCPAQQINGVCLVGPFHDINNPEPFHQLSDLNANWISIIPELKLDRKSLEIKMHKTAYDWTTNKEGYITLIRSAKAQGFQIFLKPHLILDKSITAEDLIDFKATWRGEIILNNSEDWKSIEENYSHHILELAQIAEEENVEMFCIGTELKSFTQNRKQYWISLIEKVRQVYSGEVTYSANWDNYYKIDFWPFLDQIGINSYFPISDEPISNAKASIKKWKKIKNALRRFSKKKGKKIVFTEFGYKSALYAGQQPWIHNSSQEKINYQTQFNLLSAFLKTFWKEEWIAGGFLWNWNFSMLPTPNSDFSIQDKPSEQLIQNYYSTSELNNKWRNTKSENN